MRKLRGRLILAASALSLLLQYTILTHFYVIAPSSLQVPEVVFPEHAPDQSLLERLYKNKIDIVYTWCNASDPTYMLQRNFFFHEEFGEVLQDDPKRYRYHEELKYSLRSLDMYVKWFRNVYIVSNEIPSWLNTGSPRIKVIPLEDFYGNLSHTPSFNSQSIEVNLHKIPGLSDKFIYLNDDFFIGRNVLLSDFIEPERFRNKISLLPKYTANQNNNMSIENSHRNAGTVSDLCKLTRSEFNSNHLLNKLYGITDRHDIAHAPQIFDKATLALLQQTFPEEWTNTSSHRFRSPSDIQMQHLALHFSIHSGHSVAVIEKTNNCLHATRVAFCTIKQGKVKKNVAKFNAIQKNDPLFFSLNDSVKGEWKPKLTEELYKFFQQQFPTPSQFENKP